VIDWSQIGLERAGVSFRNTSSLINGLETSGTEPHCLVVLRHGIPVLEGYWAPFAAGVANGCQSVTKTLTGIALGVAIKEGLLSLDERLIDIFPEYAHYTAGKPWWDELCVRHIATMSAGMEKQPPVRSADWIEGFFQMDILHKPGTAYMYNSIACSMVGVCIRKKTSLGLKDFLKPRVFDKLGVDMTAFAWHYHPDGQENGSGGLMFSARNSALLMELYRNGGVWDGERILPEEWVKFALQIQNPYTRMDSTYCGMMWHWKENCFVADGGMGQWAMYFPEKDAVIVIKQMLGTQEIIDNVRRAIAAYVDAMEDTEAVWTAEEKRLMMNRMSSLMLPIPPFRPNDETLAWLDKRTLDVVEGKAHFFADDLAIFDERYMSLVSSFTFHADRGDLLLDVTANGIKVSCPVSLRGYRSVKTIPAVSMNPAHTSSVCGGFEDAQTLILEIRWLESCRIHYVTFLFDEQGATITTRRVKVGGFDVPDETARALWRSQEKE
jgi:hypothetical protein